jgi:ribonuclease G
MYQLRLRNLTGMILVDFINMDSDEDKQRLLDELSKYAKRDMIKTMVVDMTALDLVEITRQKNKRSLEEQM